MEYFSRKRQAAGNICLVLFTAFLLTLVSPVMMVGSADAAINSATLVQDNGQAAVTGNSSGSPLVIENASHGSSQFSIEFNLALAADMYPLTDTDFNNMFVDILGNQVYLSAFSKVYSGVYSSVYGTVYNLVYAFTYSGTLPQDITANIYKVGSSNLLLEQIFLRLQDKPPQGGSSSPTSTTPTVVSIPSGPVTVTASPKVDGGTATVTLPPATVTAILNNLTTNKDVVIEVVKPIGTVTEIKVELPAAVLNAISEKAKDLTIKTSNVEFKLPPAALEVKELTDAVKADPNAKITIVAKEVSAASVNLESKLKDEKGLSPIGIIFEFDVVVKSTTKEFNLTSFNKKITVAIPYKAEDLKGANQDFLGVYLITANGIKYVGGKVNKVKQVVEFETGHFSNYTLMVNSKTFSDISGHWAKDDIELMAAKNIAKGITADQFAPNTTVTRAQFAALLQRALGLAEAMPAKATFTDVKATAWYYGAVEAAYTAGLIKGYGNGEFKPEGLITRQEMAIMVTNAFKASSKQATVTAADRDAALAAFADAKAISSWAKDAAAVAIKEGIVKGRTATEYAPAANATRAEGIVMIKRVLIGLAKI